METSINIRYRYMLDSWVAAYDDYRPGDPIGYGWTREEAIEALHDDCWEKVAESHVPQRTSPRLVVNNGITVLE